MPQIKIIADHRERAIIPALVECARQTSQALATTTRDDSIAVEVATLGYGDYSIVRVHTGSSSSSSASSSTSTSTSSSTSASTGASAREYAIIERKTYADFASSLIDKRMDNIPGIIEEIRARYDANADLRPVRVYLLLEGAIEYNPSEKIGGITMRAIHAKINHLMQRDGIAVIMTRDAQDTANTLCEYARDMLTLRERKRVVVGSCAHDAVNVSALTAASTVARPIIALEKRPEPTIADEIIAIFSAFPGIGQTIARKCAVCGITITDFVTYSHKCPTSITRYVQKYLSDRTYDCDVRALEGIWRVSHDIARALIAYAKKVNPDPDHDEDQDPDYDEDHDPDQDDGSLTQVCALSRAQLGAFTIKGRAHAVIGEHVYDCLHSIVVPK